MRPRGASDIASPGVAAYLRAMATGFLRFLVLIAIVLMPVRMAAQAHRPELPRHAEPIAATQAHCAERQAPANDDRPEKRVDCAMACAALPAAGQNVDRLVPPTMAARPAPATRPFGIHFGADPPPPRLS